MSENRETEFLIGAKVILPPTNNRGTVVAWRYEDFGTRSHPRQEQVVDVRFGDGSFTTMRAAHFLPAPLTSEQNSEGNET